MKLAVIGAGLAGLTCARLAANAGHDVTVFDKGRGPGGRLSTRRIEYASDQLRFDHGAMGFRPRSQAFAKVCEDWLDKLWITPWQPIIADLSENAFHIRDEETHYTGYPGMNGLIKGLCSDLSVQFGVRIHDIHRTGSGWQLTFEDDTPDFTCDGVVCATPAEQASVLLAKTAPTLAQAASKAKSVPCWAIMLAFEEPVKFEPDIVFSQTSPFTRMIRNSAKPGRADTECWVLQASPGWSEDRLNWTKDDIIAEALNAFHAITDSSAQPIVAQAHRWLYAQIAQTAPLFNPWMAETSIGVCGDWLMGADIEAAWTSGYTLGHQLATL